LQEHKHPARTGGPEKKIPDAVFGLGRVFYGRGWAREGAARLGAGGIQRTGTWASQKAWACRGRLAAGLLDRRFHFSSYGLRPGLVPWTMKSNYYEKALPLGRQGF